MTLTDPMAVVLGSFVGGLFGVLGGVLATFLTTRAEHRRHLAALRAENERHVMTLGMQLALEEWKARVDVIKTRGGKIEPPSVTMLLHSGFIRLVSEGRFTPEAYRKLCQERDAFMREVERDSGLV